MRVPSPTISLLTYLHVADTFYSGRFCPQACDLTLNYATYNDTDAWLSKQVRSCRSELRVTSLYLCFAEYCEDDGEREKWIEAQTPWCNEHAGVTLPGFHDLVDKWSSHDRASIKKLDAATALTLPELGEIVIPDQHFFHRAFTTMDVAQQQYDSHLAYGCYMYYFWVVVVTFGVSTRLLSLIRNSEHQRQYQPVPGGARGYIMPKSRSIASRLDAWVKRFITTPATFSNRCSQSYGWCTIPPRVESLTIFAFVLLNAIICTCGYQLTDGNLYWPKTSTQLLRYVSDRTGIISLANFPLVWIFGMRNDMLIWLTGWGFGTYNAFHRWVARVATLQAVVHSIGYTVMILESDGWSGFLEYWPQHYFWNGELATVAMCALLAFSLYGIRRAHYEVFLVTHIVLSIVALWTMYYHVEIFTQGDWNIFIWPCVIVWVIDRISRAGRIVAFNRRVWNVKARVSYDPASNLVRMDVDGTKNWIKPQPGTYYFAYVLDDVRYAHQSHPFTLAYMSSDSSASSQTPLSPLSARSSHHRTISGESSESDALLEPAKQAQSSSLVFLIRPYDGFTSRLKSRCYSHPGNLRVLIEGPYGYSEPFHLFPKILFIVGGTGITVPLSHLTRLLSSTSHTQSVKIVWAVREHAFLASVLRDFAGLLGNERVYLEVHITRDREVEAEVLGEDLKSVRIVTKRPDVYNVVREAARETGQEKLAVVACGPASMADQARSACVDQLEMGHLGVEYFEERFHW